MKVKKVAWLSRHEMSQDQRQDLEAVLGSEIKVSTINVTWMASDDAKYDFVANTEVWRSLRDFDVVAGVFPPVCLSSQAVYGRPVYTPISRQAPELRKGDGPIPFQHLRWEKLINGALALYGLREMSEMPDYDASSVAREFLSQV